MVRWVIFVLLMIALPARAQDVQRLGIFGVVDSIAPLVVAGHRIHRPDGVPVISPLGPDQDIQLGDTLAIAMHVLDGQLTALRILEIYPIVGPVAEENGSTAVVMGTAVHVPPDAAMKVGAWVAVSGMWSGEKVITTNLRRIDGGGFGQVAGVVVDDGLRIGGSTLRGGQRPSDGFGNDIWLLSGTPDAAGLNMRLMTKGVFGGAVDLALWQGHASGPVASQTYEIYGTGIIGTARDAQMPEAGARITRCAAGARVVDVAPEGAKAAFDLLGCANRTQGG